MSELDSTKNRKFTIAATLEDCRLGQAFDRLPSHVTIVPPFLLPWANFAPLHELLADRAKEHSGILVVGGNVEMFGPDQDAEVLRLGGIMFGVHAAYTAVVKRLQGEFDETYTGLDWNPHTKSDLLAEGEMRRINDFQLFEYIDGGAKIVRAVYTPIESYLLL